MKPLIEADEAKKLIHTHLPQAPTIDCPLDKCAGRILKQSILADRPMPPFDRSMMDGYALRAAEAKTGAILKVSGTAAAGTEQIKLSSETHSCVEVMTGAILPTGADCVVPYEDTELVSENTIRITDKEPIESGDFVHHKGSDFAANASLLEPGTTLGSLEIAAAASCGYDTLKVSKIPAIAIACSGDELVDVGVTPEPHQIRRSNDYCVETALARAGLHAAERSHLPDDQSITGERLKHLVETSDIVILSGGISKGKKDYIPELLNSLGLDCKFHGVAQRPGKPMGFWANSRCAVFALPGNPLSTLTAAHHYLIPAIRKSLGQEATTPQRIIALTESAKVPPHLTVFLPVTLEGQNQARPCPAQNSGDLVRILQSDGYIEIPAGNEQAEAGKPYTYHSWL